MPNNKDNQKTGSQGSQGSMGNNSGREFEDEQQNTTSRRGGMGQQAGGYGKDAGMQEEMDDDMTTAGGREGQFSDKNRGSEGQWSPSSSRSADE